MPTIDYNACMCATCGAPCGEHLRCYLCEQLHEMAAREPERFGRIVASLTGSSSAAESGTESDPAPTPATPQPAPTDKPRANCDGLFTVSEWAALIEGLKGKKYVSDKHVETLWADFQFSNGAIDVQMAIGLTYRIDAFGLCARLRAMEAPVLHRIAETVGAWWSRQPHTMTVDEFLTACNIKPGTQGV